MRYGLAFLLFVLSASAPMAQPTGPDSISFAWPAVGTLRGDFGEADGGGGILQGITFAMKKGGAIRAAADGVILYAGPFRSYGALLILEHGCGFQTVVSGAASLSVATGQDVRLGDEVGGLAETGNDQEVYFELRRDGIPIDPALVMPAQGSPGPRTVKCSDVTIAGAKSESKTQERLSEAAESTGNLPSPSSTSAPVQKSAKTVWTGKFPWPARGEILESYAAETNQGINIAVPEGTDIKAVEKGIVIYAGDGLKALGNTVLVRHEGSLVTVYGHLSEVEVRRGQEVRRGEKIGKSGKSGATRRPQLHFEARKKSAPVDPAQYLSAP